MTTINVRVELDSINSAGERLTTLVLDYPRSGIHEELLTHRKLSRNVASARAIPIIKMLKRVFKNPFVPLVWGKNQAGMQAQDQVGPVRRFAAKLVWRTACYFALLCGYLLYKLGLHKQVVNRIYETFTHVSTVLTATSFDNLTGLRNHPAAEPHIQILAQKITDALNASTPKTLADGEWHIPFVTDEEHKQYPVEDLLKFSVARAARVSYLLHDGTKPNRHKDIELHDRLLVEQPVHASPGEHQGQSAPGVQSGNFTGWLQYRKTLPNECIENDPRIKKHRAA